MTQLEKNIERLSSLILNGRTPQTQIYGTLDHSTDSCPTLTRPAYENLNIVGYENLRENPFLDTYNPRSRDHSNLRYSDNNGVLNEFQLQNNSILSNFQQREQGHQNSGSESTIEKLLTRLAEGQLEMKKQCTKDSQDIKEMQNQLGDMVMKVNLKYEVVESHKTTQPQQKLEHVNVIATHNSLGEGSHISQGSDIFYVPYEEADNLLGDGEEVVTTIPKEKSSTPSYPFGINSRFDYIPFPSRLMQTKVKKMEGAHHVDIKTCFSTSIKENIVQQDSEVLEEKLENKNSQEHDKDLQDVEFVGVEESVMPLTNYVEKPL